MNKFENILAIAAEKSEKKNQHAEDIARCRSLELKTMVSEMYPLIDGRRTGGKASGICQDSINFTAVAWELKSASIGGRFPYQDLTRLLRIPNKDLVKLGKNKRVELTRMQCTSLFLYFGDKVLKRV